MTTTQSETYTDTARAILRCSVRGCRHTVRVAFETRTTVRAFQGRPSYSRAVSVEGRSSSYRDRHDLARFILQAVPSGCEHESRTFALISGSFSESVKCGPKCRSAVGASCECECGGENHGASHDR